MPLTSLSERTFRVSPRGGGFPIVRMAPGETDIVSLDFTDCFVDGDTFTGAPVWSKSSNLVTLSSESLIGSYTANVVVVAGSTEGEVMLTCRGVLTSNAREYRRQVTVHIRTAT